MKIALVDDQAEYRGSLSELLASVPEIELIGQANDGAEGVELVLQCRPDITLMDIRMPHMDGIAATAAIRERWPQACILVLTTFDEDSLIEGAMRSGAAGFILKGTPLNDLVAILRLALRGYVAIGRSSALQQASVEHSGVLKAAQKLSEREREVWALIARGLTNRDIGDRLSLTPGTVKNYITSILAVLNVRHRTEAALLWRHLQDQAGMGTPNST